MKKLFLILLAVAVLLSACSGDMNSKTAETIANMDNKVDIDEQGTNSGSSKDDTGQTAVEKEEQTGSISPDDNVNDRKEAGEAFTEEKGLIKIDKDTVLMLQEGSEPSLKIKKGNEEKVICDNLPSVPSLSQNKKKVAYLSPFEFETISEIFVYDVESGTNNRLVSAEDLQKHKNIGPQYSPRKLLWLDDKNMVVLIRFAYGTVVKGGDLYILNTENNRISRLTKLWRNEQITGMRLDDKYLYVDFIKYRDEQMNEYEEFKKAVPLKMVYESIRYGEILGIFYFVQDLEGIEPFFTEETDKKIDASLPYKEVNEDLNGDGRKENVKLQFADEYRNEYVLEVNGLRCKGYGDNMDENIFIVDIDKKDNIKEIALQEYGPSDDPATVFYMYDGRTLVKIGKLAGNCVEPGNIKGDGIVIAQERGIMLHTWFYNKNYKLGKNHMLEGLNRDFYESLYMQQPVKVKKELTLHESPNGKALLKLKPGDEVKLSGHDGIEWCLAETQEDKKGWFAVDGHEIRELRMSSSDVFDGLCFAD